ERKSRSESEQYISECDDEEITLSNNLSFIGKNGFTKWNKMAPPRNVRTRQENYVSRLPLSKLPTGSLKDPIDIWKYFVDDTIDTDLIEIQAFIELLYYAGLLKANHLNADDLWKTNGSGVEIFRVTMSLSRFRFLLRCIKIDDKATREERLKNDKLAPIRDFFE
ncbi:hypothetical protein NQ318_003195, partial [Aromia moschata]